MDEKARHFYNELILRDVSFIYKDSEKNSI
jgi:hypothetical protein